MPKHVEIKHEDPQSSLRVVNVIVVVYVIVKTIMYMTIGNPFSTLVRVAADVAMIALCFPLNGSKRLPKRIKAVLVPLVLMLIESVTCVIIGGDQMYFTFLMGTTALSFIYIDAIGLLLYVVLADIVVGQLFFVFGFNAAGVRFDFTACVYQFLAFNIINAIFYSISRFSVGQYKQFADTSQTYGQIMETTPNYMVVTNEKNAVTHISRTLLNFLGLDDPYYALGRPLIDLFASGEMKMMFHEVMHSEGYVEREMVFTLNTRKFWFMLRSTLLGESKIARFYEWEDVTALVEAKNKAEEASRTKTDFLARMSHEIRTPMNAITGLSELILREDAPTTVYDHASGIKSAGNNLLSIINDILDLSKIETGRLEILPAEYALSSMVNDIINIIRVRIAEKPLHFTVNVSGRLPEKLIGDEVRVRQVLLNMLSNAAKYTHEGIIALTLSAEDINGDAFTLRASVRDSGVGIREKDIQQLFGEFIRLDMSVNKNIQGTGLGLAITKNLCIAMGGDIMVESKYGEGSVFTATLPQQAVGDEIFAAVHDADKQNVLLYEPRAAYAASIADSLRDLGVAYRTVTDGVGFAQHLQAGGFSFVISPSFLFGEIKEGLRRTGSAAVPVLLVEYGESVGDKNTRVLVMPAHAGTIARMLNGEEIVYGAQEARVYFNAPDADILIVDDIATNLKVAEGLMAPYGMHIDTCQSGPEALALLTINRYDLVFMDHMMPGMDGIETTRRIRAMDGAYYQSVPVVALTANAVSGVREMFLQNGLNDFLAKPIEMTKLNTVLEQWIPRDKQEKAVARVVTDEKALFTIEGLDVDAGVKAVGGRVEVYVSALTLFAKDGAIRVGQMRDALAQKDMKQLTIISHALKSALANLGSAEGSAAAKQIEDDARANRAETAAEGTERFLPKLEILLGHIQKTLDGLHRDAPDKTTLDFELLRRLKEALAQMDAVTVNGHIDKLQAMKLGSDDRARVDDLYQNILMFEYDAATAIIDGLLTQDGGN